MKGIWTFDPGKETWDFEVLSHGVIELPDDFRWRLLDGARAYPQYDLEDRSQRSTASGCGSSAPRVSARYAG